MKTNKRLIADYRPIGIDGIGTEDGGDMLGYGLIMSLMYHM